MSDDDRRTDDDKKMATAIMGEDDPGQLVQLLTAYYGNRDRADRTPRLAMYLHLGLLAGTLSRMLPRGTSPSSEKSSER